MVAEGRRKEVVKPANRTSSPKPSSSKGEARKSKSGNFLACLYWRQYRSICTLLLYFSPVLKGIRQISPERTSQDIEAAKNNNMAVNPLESSKSVVEFQFNSFLQMQGIEKHLLDTSK